MIHRRAFLLPLAASVLAAPVAAGTPRTARRPVPRDLEGVWTNATYTELERPDELKSTVVSPADAKAWEAKLAKTGGVNVPVDPLGQADSEFPESGSGLMRVRGEIRGAFILDPPDGKLPYTDDAMKTLGLGKYRRRWQYDNVEQRPQNERCLTAGNAGVPMVPEADANVVQIVQTRDQLAIVAERYHDARVIRLGTVAGPAPGDWFGQSIGRWEGDTLVVTTRGFRPGVTMRAEGFFLSDQAVVEERFTRTGPAEILYRFSVDDRGLYSRPWRGELVFYPAPGRMFEYACHEGNYSLTSILSAARQGNQPPPKPAAAAASTAK